MEVDLSDVFASALKQAAAKDKSPPRPLEVQARVLLDVLAERQRSCPFKVGDLVQQRKPFSRYKWPEVGTALAVVSQVLPEPLRTEQDSTYEMADIVLLLEANGSWYEFPAESWRFEAYTGPVE